MLIHCLELYYYFMLYIIFVKSEIGNKVDFIYIYILRIEIRKKNKK